MDMSINSKKRKLFSISQNLAVPTQENKSKKFKNNEFYKIRENPQIRSQDLDALYEEEKQTFKKIDIYEEVKELEVDQESTAFFTQNHLSQKDQIDEQEEYNDDSEIVHLNQRVNSPVQRPLKLVKVTKLQVQGLNQPHYTQTVDKNAPVYQRWQRSNAKIFTQKKTTHKTVHRPQVIDNVPLSQLTKEACKYHAFFIEMNLRYPLLNNFTYYAFERRYIGKNNIQMKKLIHKFERLQIK